MRNKRAILFAILLSFLIASPSYALDDWTKKDTAYQLAFTALHIINFGQTRDIAKNPDKFYELDPILGKHPSIGRVNTYFVVTTAGHAVISYILPAKFRRYWQVVWIGLSAGTVIRNFNIGLRVNF